MISLHDRKTVYDEYNQPLVTLRRHNAHATVIADASTTKQDVFTIESRGDMLFIDMSTQFTDSETGATHKLEIAGSWNPRKALVWLVRGPERIPVGRIAKDGHYLDIEVAPGVDVALVLLFCIILDGKNEQQWLGSSGPSPLVHLATHLSRCSNGMGRQMRSSHVKHDLDEPHAELSARTD